MANRFWVGGTGDWDASTKTHWAATSGGAGGETVPTSSDDVYFDLHSNEPGDTDYTCTITARTYSKNVDISFTGTSKVTIAGNSALFGCYGNLNISGGTAQVIMSFSYDIVFFDNAILTTNGVIINADIYLSSNSKTLTLGGDLTISSTKTLILDMVSNSTITVSENNYIISAGNFAFNATSGSNIILGSGTHLLTGTGFVIQCSAGTTIDGTGTIKITNTSNTAIAFYGGGKVYNNVWFSRGNSTATNTIYYSNTFAELKDDGTAAHTIKFEDGKDQTITSLNVNGSAGKLIILTGTSTAGWKISDTTGINEVTYCDIHYSTAEGGATWNAYTSNGNVDGGNNSGWLFEFPSILSVSIFDNINITENILNQRYILDINIFDSINITENLTRQISTSNISTFDSINVTENLTRQISTSNISTFDSINITENLTRQISTSNISTFDSINVTENLTRQVSTYYISTFDHIHITESAEIPPIPRTLFWNPNGEHDVSDPNTWSLTDGGTPNQATPTIVDDVFFSNTNNNNCLLTTNMTCKSINFNYGTGYSGKLYGENFNQHIISVDGDITFSSGMTGGGLFSSSVIKTIGTSGTQLITTNGNTNLSININCNGTNLVQLVDDLNAASFSVPTGDFDANNMNLRTNSYNMQTTGTVTMGDGIWYIDKISGGFSVSANTDLVCSNSEIKMVTTGTGVVNFAGGGKTYNKVTYDRGTSTGSNTISGNNTFNTFTDTGTAAHSLLWTAGSIQHFTNFNVNGSAGKLITLNSTTTGAYNFVKDSGGYISCDYLNIQHSVATPINTWYAGEHSVDNQSTSTVGSGWIFLAPILFVSIFDSINVIENLTEVRDLEISIFDSIDIKENILSQAIDNNISVYDSISLVELLSTDILYNISIHDDVYLIGVGLNTYDDPDVSYDDALVSYDSIQSDYVKIELTSDITNVDYINISETADITPLVLSDIYIYDIVDITENLTEINLLFISVSDSINIIEDITVVRNLTVSVFDYIDVIENLSIQLEDLNIDTYDLINITENFLGIRNLAINVSDSINLSEFNYDEVVYTIEVYDRIALLGVGLNTYDDPNVSYDDIFIPYDGLQNDYVKIELNSEVIIVDYISINDVATTLSLDLGDINITDTININENYQTERIFDISIFDSINITENLSQIRNLTVSVFDNITITETINIDPLLLDASIYDVIDVNESFYTEVSSPLISISDSVTINEDETIILSNPYVFVSDLLNITESNTCKISTAEINIFNLISVVDDRKIELLSFLNDSNSIIISENVTLESFRFSPSVKKPVGTSHSIGRPSGSITSIRQPSGGVGSIRRPIGSSSSMRNPSGSMNTIGRPNGRVS